VVRTLRSAPHDGALASDRRSAELAAIFVATERVARLFGKLSAGLRVRRLRRSIEQALALNRKQVRPDGLCIANASFRLAITWRAREIHPWDCDLPYHQRLRRLVNQTFSDTESALERLFGALPEVDTIDLKVLEADAARNGTLMIGSVSRSEFERFHPSSTAMRLRLVGVDYNLVDSCFEPLALRPAPGANEAPVSGLDVLGPGESRTSSKRTRGLGEGGRRVWHQPRAGPH